MSNNNNNGILIVGGLALAAMYLMYKASPASDVVDTYNKTLQGAGNTVKTIVEAADDTAKKASDTSYNLGITALGGAYSPAAQYANDILKGYHWGTTSATVQQNSQIMQGTDAYNSMVATMTKLGVNMPKLSVPLWNPFR